MTSAFAGQDTAGWQKSPQSRTKRRGGASAPTPAFPDASAVARFMESAHAARAALTNERPNGGSTLVITERRDAFLNPSGTDGLNGNR